MKIICTQQEFDRMKLSCHNGDCYECVFDHFCKHWNNLDSLDIEITDIAKEVEE